jgi:hypothetical protein
MPARADYAPDGVKLVTLRLSKIVPQATNEEVRQSFYLFKPV